MPITINQKPLVMKKYVKNGKEMFETFEKALKESSSIKEAADKCEYELYCYDSFKGNCKTETTACINLSGDTTIAVMVDVDFITGKLYLHSHCEIVNPETNDWDGEVYDF